jgi:hypothetical protein
MGSIPEHADDDESGREYDDKLLMDVFVDERTVDAP